MYLDFKAKTLDDAVDVLLQLAGLLAGSFELNEEYASSRPENQPVGPAAESRHGELEDHHLVIASVRPTTQLLDKLSLNISL